MSKKHKKSDKKSIAIFGTFFSHRGYNKVPCEDLAERLEDLNWTVAKSSMKMSKIGRLVDMITTAWMKRHSYNIALVEVYSGQAFIWAEAVCQALRLIKKQYVLVLHGGNLPDFSRRWPRRVNRILNSAARVVTPSNYLRENMRRFRDDLILIANPIELSSYRFRLRQKIAPQLVWLRAFHEIYNPTLAPRIVELLLKKDLDIHLTMVGPDKNDGSLQKTKYMARNLSVFDRIDFKGGVPKERIPANLEPHDIFINTTNIDNMPISILEAMACGLCVVSTDVGGIPYLLEHEKDALLVPPNNPEAMADAVCRILSEPGLAEHLSRNARTKAEKFDWSVILPQWEDILAFVEQGYCR